MFQTTQLVLLPMQLVLLSVVKYLVGWEWLVVLFVVIQ